MSDFNTISETAKKLFDLFHHTNKTSLTDKISSAISILQNIESSAEKTSILKEKYYESQEPLIKVLLSQWSYPIAKAALKGLSKNEIYDAFEQKCGGRNENSADIIMIMNEPDPFTSFCFEKLDSGQITKLLKNKNIDGDTVLSKTKGQPKYKANVDAMIQKLSIQQKLEANGNLVKREKSNGDTQQFNLNQDGSIFVSRIKNDGTMSKMKVEGHGWADTIINPEGLINQSPSLKK